MRGQYQFDPIKVELPFGQDDSSPPWTVDLDRRHRLELYGRIDRVDLYSTPDTNEALCVVVDYKSSQKQLDPVLMAHGLQLQLLTYLNVLRHWPDSRSMFGSAHLKPAGLFYVNLRGKYHQAPNRKEALGETREARKLAYRHSGRFDASALQLLDGRKDARAGDQFNYRRTEAGRVHKGCREAMATADLYALLDSVESNLRKMGLQIYSGAAQVAPYRKGAVTACDQCDYRSICRLDPWTHRYRVLRNDPRRH
jgi:ATP-dependent helicase/nuclease subunit B